MFTLRHVFSATPLVLLILAGIPAGAQELSGGFTTLPDYVLDPDSSAGNYYAAGIGSPAVTYDSANDKFVMFFSTRLDNADPTNCPLGRWGIGRAESTDAVNWTVFPADAPVVAPGNLRTPGREWAFDDCLTAQSSVLIDDTGTWHMWYKTHPRPNACTAAGSPWQRTTNPPPWGCPDGNNFISGIGYATSTDGVTFDIQDKLINGAPAPVIISSSASFPAVIQFDGRYEMVFQQIRSGGLLYDLYSATSPDGVEWTVNPERAIQVGFASWVTDIISSSTYICDTSSTYSREVWSLGVRRVGGITVEGGLGRNVNVDGTNFFPWDPGSPFETFAGAPSWRTARVLKIGRDYLVYFAQPSAGVNHVGLAMSDPSLLDDLAVGASPAQRAARVGQISQSVCESPPDPCDISAQDLPAAALQASPARKAPGAYDGGQAPYAEGSSNEASCSHTPVPAGLLALGVGIFGAGRRRRAN